MERPREGVTEELRFRSLRPFLPLSLIPRPDFRFPLPRMFWSNVNLIFLRELRDQLRDRRTLFAVVVLPLLLYPLLGMLIFQVQQFLKEHTSKIRIVTAGDLPDQPRLLDDGKLAAEFGDARYIEIELAPRSGRSLEE